MPSCCGCVARSTVRLVVYPLAGLEPIVRFEPSRCFNVYTQVTSTIQEGSPESRELLQTRTFELDLNPEADMNPPVLTECKDMKVILGHLCKPSASDLRVNIRIH